MHYKQMKESKFLKKEDCGAGILVTVKGVTQHNVAVDGAPEEMKWCLDLAELDKPMVLNSVNCQLIASFCGEDTDDWTGKKIVLYSDPSVSYGGKLVGGIRVRAPRLPKAPAKPAPVVAPVEVQPPDPVDDGTGEQLPF